MQVGSIERISILILAAGLSAPGADGPMDTGPLQGMWSAHCSWGTSIQRTREPHRILRAIDRDALELLDWVEATQDAEDPRLTKAGWVVLDGPNRMVVKRTGNATFANEDAGVVLKFTSAGKGVEMERGADACNGLGGDYVFTLSEKTITPSFPCAKAKQAREQLICGNGELAMLDQHLALAYRAAERRIQWKYGTAAVRTAKLKGLTTSQSKWWSGELSKCQSAQCVAPLYEARIEYLTQLDAEEK